MIYTDLELGFGLYIYFISFVSYSVPGRVKVKVKLASVPVTIVFSAAVYEVVSILKNFDDRARILQ